MEINNYTIRLLLLAVLTSNYSQNAHNSYSTGHNQTYYLFRKRNIVNSKILNIVYNIKFKYQHI